MGVGRVNYFCDACWDSLELLRSPWCQVCGIPLSPKDGFYEVICRGCRTINPTFGKLRAIAFYDRTMREAIHLMKYEKKPALAKHLVRLGQTHLPDDLNASDYDFLVPIPLHTNRYRTRGFNQAERIARGIGKVWGLPVRTDVLFRIRNTVPQSQLESVEARERNIRGAFDVRLAEGVRESRILLVDDIFTTGTTIREAIRVLRAAKPNTVDVLTLTRTRPKNR